MIINHYRWLSILINNYWCLSIIINNYQQLSSTASIQQAACNHQPPVTSHQPPASWPPSSQPATPESDSWVILIFVNRFQNDQVYHNLMDLLTDSFVNRFWNMMDSLTDFVNKFQIWNLLKEFNRWFWNLLTDSKIS